MRDRNNGVHRLYEFELVFPQYIYGMYILCIRSIVKLDIEALYLIFAESVLSSKYFYVTLIPAVCGTAGKMFPIGVYLKRFPVKESSTE